jgi:hypothetical protein
MSFSGRNIQNFKGHFPVAMSLEQNPGGLAICTKGQETRKAKKNWKHLRAHFCNDLHLEVS